MRSIRLASLAVSAVVLFLPTARAGLILEFDQADFAASPVKFVDVPVFLTESGTTFLTDEGLNSAGLIISFNLPDRSPDPA